MRVARYVTCLVDLMRPPVGFAAWVLVVVGVALGIVMGWRARVGYALDPIMTVFYASPRVALAPLGIVFFDGRDFLFLAADPGAAGGAGGPAPPGRDRRPRTGTGRRCAISGLTILAWGGRMAAPFVLDAFHVPVL